MRTTLLASVDQLHSSDVLPRPAGTGLPLAEELTEFLDRAAFLWEWPLYPPSRTEEQGQPQLSETPDWMDAERRSREQWNPDQVRIAPDQLVRIGIERREALSRRLAQLEARGRTPRACLYSVGHERLTLSFAASRSYANDRKWRVEDDRCIADSLSATSPMHRPGWRWMLHLIRTGRADGIVSLAHTSISSHTSEYKRSLDLIEHHGGFVALVTLETARAEVMRTPTAAVLAHRRCCHAAYSGGVR